MNSQWLCAIDTDMGNPGDPKIGQCLNSAFDAQHSAFDDSALAPSSAGTPGDPKICHRPSSAFSEMSSP